MAHSNRAKLKASRGGLTRNQQRKVRNTSNVSGNQRLQEVINWLAKKEEAKQQASIKTVTKVIDFPKDRRTINRRISVLGRLEQQLKLGVKPLESARLQYQFYP